MGNKFITTMQENIRYNILLDEKDKLLEISISKNNSHLIMGNIYCGRVSNIVKGINAAFVNIGVNQDVFLSLKKGDKYLYTNGKSYDEPLKIGDELLVQVIKDASDNKAASVTSTISITGRYLVITFSKSFIGMSSKIRDTHTKVSIKNLLKQYITDTYGFIVRTNAKGVEAEYLESEAKYLIEVYNKLIESSQYVMCYKCIYRQPQSYMKYIRDLYGVNIDQYIFDDKEIYEECLDYFSKDYFGELTKKFSYYEDDYSLFKLYNLGAQIEKVTNERVWLKSGANLVIQPTESLTAIDVNTSKSVSKKSKEETIIKTNLEAAKEVARQLRLRNISGIIIVDFIDMEKEENNKRLLNELKLLLEKDRIKTNLIDMTPLGLVEITRKKTSKNIYNQFNDIKNDIKSN
jgi:ribonuclease G